MPGRCRLQALAAGLTAEAVDWRLRHGGPWRRLFPGVYATFTGPLTDLHRWHAARAYGGVGAVLTGVPALVLADLASTATGPVPILLPHDRRRRSLPGVVAVRTHRMPRARERHGLDVAEPVHALADACRLTRDLVTVRALVTGCLRSAQVTVGALFAELDEGPRKGSALLRAALEEYGDGVRSVAESEARQRLLALSIPPPRFNVDLVDGNGDLLARPDAYWEEAALAFEVDSRRHHGDMAGWEHTQRRHALLAANGVTTMHASPHRIHTDWSRLGPEVEAAYHLGRTHPAPRVRVRTS